MIGALVSLLSLNMTLSLIQDYGVVAATLNVTGATATTPIHLTVPNHGFPIPENGQQPNRAIHGVVSGVTGMTEANGLWVLTGVDANTLSLSTFDAQGNLVQSVGTHTYTGGGQVQYAFPDGQILLGRRNARVNQGVATPRVLFIPTRGKAWDFEPYGGANPNIVPATVPKSRGSAEQQSMTLEPQVATQFTTFDVYVNSCGEDYGDGRSPDFYDFDATQAIVGVLITTIFNAVGGRFRVLAEDWPSQAEQTASQIQRGQQWVGRIELQQPVTPPAKSFVPIGTKFQETVQPANPGPTDPLTFNVT